MSKNKSIFLKRIIEALMFVIVLALGWCDPLHKIRKHGILT